MKRVRYEYLGRRYTPNSKFEYKITNKFDGMKPVFKEWKKGTLKTIQHEYDRLIGPYRRIKIRNAKTKEWMHYESIVKCYRKERVKQLKRKII